MDFKTQFCNFVEDTIRSVPEYEDRGYLILEDINERGNINKYRNHFLTTVKDNSERITNQDESLFLEDDLLLISNMSLKNYWGEFSDNTKGTIWKYIQILMLCAHVENATRELRGNVEVENETIETDDNEANAGAGADSKPAPSNIGEIPSFEGFSDFLEKDMNSDMMKKMINNLKKSAGTTKQNDEFMKDIMGSKIGGLAKEIAESIGTEDLAKSLGIDEKTKENPMEIFKKFTSKEGSKKMMSMMSKIGNTLQEKMSSGELNPQDLVQEAMGMMGKIGKNPMMKGIQSLLQREGRRNQVAQRLRRKYDERQRQLAAEQERDAETQQEQSQQSQQSQNATQNEDGENKPKRKRKGGKRGGRKVKK
jgi:hypothetical protein